MYAIGTDKQILLVQSTRVKDMNDVSKMRLLHSCYFNPLIHRVVQVETNDDARMIAALFTSDAFWGAYPADCASRRLIDFDAPIKVFEVPR